MSKEKTYERETNMSKGRQPCSINLEMSSSFTSLRIPLSRSVEYEIC